MMKAKRNTQTSHSADACTTARIVTAATRLFASRGFEGTTTKEICEQANVNIAAIHYHFGSKEELLQHILASFGGSRLESVERTLKAPKDKDELRIRLEMFLVEWIDAFIQQPEVYKIVQREIELLHSRSEKVFQATLLKACETLTNFLAVAKERSLLRNEIDPRIAARTLYSQLLHQARSDSVNKRYYGTSIRDVEYRQRWLEQTLDTFLHGVSRS